MSGGKIWWERIGNSIRFLNEISDALQDCQSTILIVPKELPWRDMFYQSIEQRRLPFSESRRLVRLKWTTGAEPGQFVLDELCPKDVQADYWPGESYAKYLGNREDLALCEYYVWITDIHLQQDEIEWCRFIKEYQSASNYSQKRAVFILECDDHSLKLNEMNTIIYEIRSYDCRVFCLERAAELNNSYYIEYQAELALSLGKNDPEYSNVLLEEGEELLKEPVSTALKCINGVNSNGLSFQSSTEMNAIQSAWKASVSYLFPIIEKHRTDFVERHADELKVYLPITNPYGGTISDPRDLEIGHIAHFINCGKVKASKNEAIEVMTCRDGRNLLAHNKLIPYDGIRVILSSG